MIMGKTKMTERCATVSVLQKILGGKWKIEILYYISLATRRFGELQRQIGDITQSTLTKQLRELEADGFISRYIFQEIPPKVEYSLTDLGRSFVPVLEKKKKWGDNNLKIKTLQ
jgi:DNA-binding HxlR family transcriptional regulator